ncbi:hypothetical protein EYF80_020819 [Liparis tanakae]|uniref:Uncharacterized protein n=1 Tax=Liparis tanakae TaxID=230148 RepID=A0A4Z2HT80_9TELE|nr:hypothetical protein EYF80_020819 [Liparis tanakae]
MSSPGGRSVGVSWMMGGFPGFPLFVPASGFGVNQLPRLTHDRQFAAYFQVYSLSVRGAGVIPVTYDLNSISHYGVEIRRDPSLGNAGIWLKAQER